MGHVYRVKRSEDDQGFVATISEFPSLSFRAPTPKEALDGLRALVRKAEVDTTLDLLRPDPWDQAEVQCNGKD